MHRKTHLSCSTTNATHPPPANHPSFPPARPSPDHLRPPPSSTMGYFWSPYLEIAMASSLVLLALAAPAHFRARNTGSILYICWAALGNLVFLVNKLVWSDHVRNIAPIWCDISESNLIFRLLLVC